MVYKTYKITKITKGIINNYIKFELNGNVEFGDGNYNFIFCVNDFPYKNYQRGDEIEINTTNAKHMNSQNYHQGIVRKISNNYIETFYDDYEIPQGSNNKWIGTERTQGAITLSAYEVEAVYDFLYGSLEWLELYIEKSNYYPNWQLKKQIPKTITRPDIPYLDAKETKEHFLTSLSGLKAISIGKPPFLLEKLQTEFFSWLDSSGIGANSCPAELTQSLVDFHNILIGKTGEFTKRRRKEVDENIAKMTSEERQRNFHEIVAAYQEPLENEDKVFETMKGKTYKDVDDKSRFSGDIDRGKGKFGLIKRQLETSQSNSQQRSNSQVIQEFRNNRQDWRIDEVITEYDNQGRATKREQALIHKSAEIGLDGTVYDSQPVYPVRRFNQEEISQINQILNSSRKSSVSSQSQAQSSHKDGKGGGSGGLGGYGSPFMWGSFTIISLIGLAFVR